VLRQLARLTVGIPAAGQRAVAVAVYADACDLTIPAADLGYEGVACVDDAARALFLFCDLWERTGVLLFRKWSEGLLDFLLYMQRKDGRFVNFVADCDGTRNETGVTSRAGGDFWQARGVRALAKAALLLDDGRAGSAFERGLARVRERRDVPPDVRSIHVLMAIELLRTGRVPDVRADLERWCDEIAALRRGDVLLDNPDQVAPHLWGHQQEGALALAGAYLERPDLVEIARRSALAYLAPLIESGFDAPTVQPYGVAAAIGSVEQLALITAEPRFADLVLKARGWFDGRNTAGRPVYDRVVGRVRDGIDDGVLNEHSGAESNIAAAEALIDEVAANAARLLPEIEAAMSAELRTPAA
jgi:hypothetical protein